MHANNSLLLRWEYCTITLFLFVFCFLIYQKILADKRVAEEEYSSIESTLPKKEFLKKKKLRTVT